MMPNRNIQVVRQHQIVVPWIRLRQMKKLKETKPNGQLTHKKIAKQKIALDKNYDNNENNKNDINNKSNSNNRNNNNNNNNKMQR